jgi:hypothetical protein
MPKGITSSRTPSGKDGLPKVVFLIRFPLVHGTDVVETIDLVAA